MEKTKYGGIFRRILAGLLALVMILGVVPMNGIKVEAAETEEEDNVETLLLDTEITVTEHLDFVFVPEETGYYVLQSIGENPIYEVNIHDTHEEYEFEKNNKEVVSFYLEKGEEYEFGFWCYYEEDEYVFKMLYAGTENPEFWLSYEEFLYVKDGDSISLSVEIEGDNVDIDKYKFIWYDSDGNKLGEGSTYSIEGFAEKNDGTTYICEVTTGYFMRKANITVYCKYDISLNQEISISKDKNYSYVPEQTGYYVIKATGENPIYYVKVYDMADDGEEILYAYSTEARSIYLEQGQEYMFAFDAYLDEIYTAQLEYAGKVNPYFWFTTSATAISLKEGEKFEAITTIKDYGMPENGYSYKWYYAPEYYYYREETEDTLEDKYLTLIDGATESFYAINNVTSANKGTYVCVATNGYNITKRTIFRLTVCQEERINEETTVKVTVQPGGEIELTINFTADQEGYYLLKADETEGFSELEVKKYLTAGDEYSEIFTIDNTADIVNEVIINLEYLGGTQPDFNYTITKIDDEEYQVEGVTGEVKWLYDSATDHLKIYGNGKMEDYANSEEANQGIGVIEESSFDDALEEIMGEDYSDWIEIDKITVESGVTRIGDYAFAGLYSSISWCKVYVADTVTEIGNYVFREGKLKDCYFYGDAPKTDKSYDNSLGEKMAIVFLEDYKESWNSIVEKYGEVLIDDWQNYWTGLYKHIFYVATSFDDEEATMTRLNPSPWYLDFYIESLWKDLDGNDAEENREKTTFVIEGDWFDEPMEITASSKYAYSDGVILEPKDATYTLKVYQKPGSNKYVQYDTTVHTIIIEVVMSESNTLTAFFTLDGEELYVKGGIEAGSFTNIIDVSHEHMYKETIVNPTCTEKGYTKHVCEDCGYTYTDNETAALGHQWKEVIDKAATTTATGLKHEECTVCGKKQKENTVIAKLPSTGETTTPGGNTSGETQTPSGDVTDDSQVNEENTEQQPSTDDKEVVVYPEQGTLLTDDQLKATFTVIESGKTVAYAGTTNKKAISITIPTTVTIDGVTYTVTSIAKNAFKNNKKITKVTIGNSITSIGASAFQNCTALKTVKMGSGVTTIGSKAFYGCKKLTSLTIGKNVTSIGTSAFQNCTSLKKVTIPSKVKKIGSKVFYGCKKLTNIIIKTTKLTTKNVGKQAFTKAGSSNYKKLTVKVPKSKLSAYKKLLKAKGIFSKAKVKK